MKFIVVIFLLTFSTYVIGAGSSSDKSNAKSSNQIQALYEKAEEHISNQKYKLSLHILKSLTKREDLDGLRADI